ncbi:MAG: selenocysteine-specific translation elongation factor [Acidimicrobiia bacterium]|nr:selenocysteine-specific translation elongation factor [Acidimicrobiia bacterium]NNL28200.1 selenocysteine-specific translation elongation factor [Acidimicrobiia bacterium]
MAVIGTAGHVDHGKSTLVTALTGRDPDRWAEEKRRGLTIDLGFAWTTLPSGTEVGFVDVPGHEKFLKNMLAGIESIDVGLLVIAADEGWMPQTEEHLAVLDAVGIDNLVIALSRVDLVDGETAELARMEVEDMVAGTGAERAPVVLTSATSGAGLDQLRSELDAAVSRAGVSDSQRPRLWVDRVFPVAGAGTVVTGTLTGGALSVDDKVWIWPLEREVRVRGLHSHDEPRSTVVPGNRTAVNLVGVDHGDLKRGAMLGRSGAWEPSARWLVRLETVRNIEDPITSRGAFSVHLGSGAWSCRVRPLQGSIEKTGLATITLPIAVPTEVGDRFVLFDAGRRMVVAGGLVLDPSPARQPDISMASAPINTADDRATSLLNARGVDTVERLAAHSGGGSDTSAIAAGKWLLSRSWAESQERRAIDITRSYQETNPLRPGIPKASLASRLRIDQATLESLVDWSDQLSETGAAIMTADFAGTLSDDQELTWQTARRKLKADGFAPGKISDLGVGRELVHALVRRGELEELAEGVFYLPDTLQALIDRVRSFTEPFTVSEFRDALGVTRRHAVPMLEWLDKERITKRRGDVRVVIQSTP